MPGEEETVGIGLKRPGQPHLVGVLWAEGIPKQKPRGMQIRAAVC